MAAKPKPFADARRPARNALRRRRPLKCPPARRRKISAAVPLLLEWFSGNARDLPWRRTRDPYAIWISEVMLQQTQVKTVIGYWNRWMRELPTVAALASARPQSVLKLWEGLGYYSRARNLQKAAQQIVSGNGRGFPASHSEILALPGIGRYTAGAICSIAFNQPEPLLDGNVIRVLARLFGIRDDPRKSAANAALWCLAEALVREAASTRPEQARACSALNQSLMELGALVCTPQAPDCPGCPLSPLCFARRTGKTESLPNSSPRPEVIPRRFAAFIAERKGRYLVRQRPEGGVNAHLWEFPNMELSAGATPAGALAECLPGATLGGHVCTIRHSITRHRITLATHRVRLKGKHPGLWKTPAELLALPFAGAHGKLRGQLLAAAQG